MKKLIVADNCIACGSCVIMSDFLEETSNGKAIAKETGIISEQDSKKLLEVIKICPVQSISLIDDSLVSSVGKVGLGELKKIIAEKLSNYKMEFPNPIDYEFDNSEFSAPTSHGAGEYRYEYKSDDKAIQAGVREFDRVMYSQRKAIIQQLLIQYKNKKFRKYSYYEKEKDNFYYEINKSIEKLLKQLVTEAKELSNNKISLPPNFNVFEVIPEMGISGDAMNRELFVYQLRHIEELWFVQKIINELESLNWYDSYIDTDDMVDSRGKYVYCYKNVSNACSKFGEHIINEFSYVLNGSNGVRAILEAPINKFGEAVKEEVKKKADILISAIEKNVLTISEHPAILNNIKKENNENVKTDNLEKKSVFKNKKIMFDGENYIFICPHCKLNKIVINQTECRILSKNIHLNKPFTCELCDGKISKINDIKILRQPKKIIFLCPNKKCGKNVEVDGENCIENGDEIFLDKSKRCQSCLTNINQIKIKDIVYKQL